MTFSTEWNTAYENGQIRHVGMEPTLGLLFKLAIHSMEGQRILELGCATGNNAQDLLQMGATYYGIDGSHGSISEAAATYPDAQFLCGDFTQANPFGGEFDIIFDRAAVSHNDTASVQSAIRIVYESLKPGGIYIGSDWFSTAHSEFMRGDAVDRMTRTGYVDGQFTGVGKCHFTNEQELNILFADFERLLCNHRVNRYVKEGIFLHRRPLYRWVSTAFDGMDYDTAVFDFAVRKPK